MDNPVALVMGIIVIIAVGFAAFYIYNLAQPTVTRKARVVGKWTFINQQQETSAGVTTACHCSFEFEDGQRTEYDVSQVQYAMIAEGDRGELDTKGALFWDFRRGTQEPLRSPISDDDVQRLRAAICAGRKIEAIKLYRECTGKGLQEAQEFIETLEGK